MLAENPQDPIHSSLFVAFCSSSPARSFHHSSTSLSLVNKTSLIHYVGRTSMGVIHDSSSFLLAVEMDRYLTIIIPPPPPPPSSWTPSSISDDSVMILLVDHGISCPCGRFE
ncbi:hypothetical protein PGTUg99_023296 [Puccinia graminis f. sp. tritici]|uniref:Uncharacterized protein n=1 Tax=Puccinia graminis f. sp. tritici TaxID=56615 RepID=A0A5B0NLE0_PUCGR|nr:hypothetical protein PGTUg99_023296 [Puccinia graminis f. sp. tritici]